jgi:hypothetical protein
LTGWSPLLPVVLLLSGVVGAEGLAVALGVVPDLEGEPPLLLLPPLLPLLPLLLLPDLLICAVASTWQDLCSALVGTRDRQGHVSVKAGDV